MEVKKKQNIVIPRIDSQDRRLEYTIDQMVAVQVTDGASFS